MCSLASRGVWAPRGACLGPNQQLVSGRKDWERVWPRSSWIMDSWVLKYTFLCMFSHGYHPTFELNAFLRPGWGGTALPLAGPGVRGLPAVGTALPQPVATRLPQAQPRPADPKPRASRTHRAGVSLAVLPYGGHSRDPEPCWSESVLQRGFQNPEETESKGSSKVGPDLP